MSVTHAFREFLMAAHEFYFKQISKIYYLYGFVDPHVLRELSIDLGDQAGMGGFRR
jgi:hypothetical protein